MFTENDYCLGVTRRYDPDRYLLSLFCKRDVRGALWALLAFNHEIAKTREVVTETATGLIRLQWWRDAISKIYEGEVLEHEVVKAVADVIKRYGLPKEQFETLIYAREFDVEDRAPADMDGFLKYCEVTSVPLHDLMMGVIDEQDGAFKNVSIRYAAIGLIRAVPHYIARRRCLLPSDIMQEHGVSVSKIYDWNNHEGIMDVLQSILKALPEIDTTESKFFKKMNRLTDIYERQLEKCGYNPFDERMNRPPRFKEFRLLVG